MYKAEEPQSSLRPRPVQTSEPTRPTPPPAAKRENESVAADFQPRTVNTDDIDMPTFLRKRLQNR
jgi:hypothetical protein